jgi:uncharacterized membrane protein YidH (DUF202 family)
MLAKAAEAREICSRIPPRYGETQPSSALWLILCAGLVAAGTAVLYFFNPTHSGFYPTCVFYKTTGLLCPGCGCLRAMHQLLHGHMEAAFRFNALFVSSLPVVALGCVQAARYRAADRPALAWLRPSLLWAGFALLVIFGILRNLPDAPHYFLAPL